MKIRTIEDLQEAVDAEMAWRKHDLTAIKANINSSRAFAKDSALRAGITLLYAHWEGAIKNIASYYLQYVSNLKLPYNKLMSNFLAISTKAEINSFTETNKVSLQTKVIDTVFAKYAIKSNIPYTDVIKTNSNLNSNVFSEIMSTIGLKCDYYETNYTLIDEVLLNMRNRIAHGQKLDILSLDEDRYNEIHDKILSLMVAFSNQVTNAAINKEYLNTP